MSCSLRPPFRHSRGVPKQPFTALAVGTKCLLKVVEITLQQIEAVLYNIANMIRAVICQAWFLDTDLGEHILKESCSSNYIPREVLVTFFVP